MQPGDARQPASEASRLAGSVRERLLREYPALCRRAGADPLARQVMEAVVARFLASQPGALPELPVHVVAELVGLGPLDALLRDEEVTEIMANGPGQVFVERRGALERVEARFESPERLQDLIQRLVAPLGRRLDLTMPYVDARLPDGSRLHAILPPLAVGGPFLTIRKFGRRYGRPEDLMAAGSLSGAMLSFLERAVKGRLNILVTGGASSGKTTTLNVLGAFVGEGERVITIEDTAELNLAHGHVVALEGRPPGLEGSGAVPLRTLLANALRMRPDRLVVGEVRGAEAFDLLQALNTGHGGSMATLHANSPSEAMGRLATLALMAGEGWPHGAILEQIAASLHLVIHQERLAEGRRVLSAIAAVEADHRGWPVLRDVFRFHPGRGEGGALSGRFLSVARTLPPRLQSLLEGSRPPGRQRLAVASGHGRGQGA